MWYSAWSDPLPTPFDLNTYLKCQPKFDLSAWLHDTSVSVAPGCPTTRLADCADKDFEVCHYICDVCFQKYFLHEMHALAAL
jgi:hypothetical protein